MFASEFYTIVNDLKQESSRNKKKETIRELVENNPKQTWESAILLLAGQRFENNGVATKTAKKAFLKGTNCDEETLESYYTETGTVTKAIEKIVNETEKETYDFTVELSTLVTNLEEVAALSGDAQISRLANVFATSHPMVVCFGVLPNDYSIGVTPKTIASGIANDYSRSEIERARGLKPDSIEYINTYIDADSSFPPEFTVGTPFLPMKAKDKEMPDSTEIENWVAQMKVDGFRLLIHVKDNSAEAYTRKMEDETHSLPELTEISWPDGEYVFDCEAIAYENGEPQGYRATSERIGRKHNIDMFTTKVHFEAFDCLYANGDISTKSFEERFSVLTNVFPDHDYTSILEIKSDIAEAKNEAKEDGFEGVIVKDLSAPYKFDKRSSYWRKLKFTGETIDLKVVDFEVGKGDDAGTLGRMKLETSDGVDMGWVGNGWTDEEQDKIWENQDEYLGEIAEISFEGIDKKPRFPVFENWRPQGEVDSFERIQNIGAKY